MIVQGSNSILSASALQQKRPDTPTTRLQSREPLEQRVASAKAETTQNEIAERRQLQELRNRDREVRAHELAHVSVGGRYVTKGANFRYETGPDGRRYAVAGEVSIDTSEVPGDPQATLNKAQVVRRAALAPANPSAQDRQVAAQAIAMIQQARIELAVQAKQETRGSQLDTFA